MKRDNDLIRKILLKLEEAPPLGLNSNPRIEDYGVDVIGEHLQLLSEKGYISGIDLNHFSSTHFELTSIKLEWGGHDLLDSIRDEKKWNRIKKEIKKKGVMHASFEIIKEIAVSLS